MGDAVSKPTDIGLVRGEKIVLFLLVALFFLAALPDLSTEVRYHGDERFYIDSAMRMVHTGDYMTPYYADGRPRFKKPILAYWVMVAAYHLMGISFLSSRLPFLLTGCGVIWVTWKMARELFRTEATALTSASLIASNIAVFIASVRSTPDILSCLFVSLSFLGFLRLIFTGDRGTWSYALAYGGAGFAVATKGLVGIFPVLFAFLFCLLRRKSASATARDLVQWPTMFVSAGIALFWFILVYWKNGGGALEVFFADQVEDKVESSTLQVLLNALFYLLAPVRHFFPWSAMLVLALVLAGEGLRKVLRVHGKKLFFAIGSFLVVLVIFSWSRDMRARYLLPVYPLLASVMSPLLIEGLARGRSAGILSGTLKGLLGIVGVGGGAMLVLGGFLLDWRIILAGAVLMGIAAFDLLIIFPRGWQATVVGTSAFLLVVFGVTETLVRPVFRGSPVPQLTKRIMSLSPMPKKIGTLGVPGRFTTSLLLHLKGNTEIVNLENVDPTGALESPSVVVVTESSRPILESKGYRLEECGYFYDQWKAADLWRVIGSGDKEVVFAKRKIRCYMAIRAPAGFPPFRQE